MDVTQILLSALGGYILGSIPFGLLLAKLAGYGDIRKIGSGNIGATNVLRTGNKPLALAVLILDSAKGAMAVLLSLLFIPAQEPHLISVIAGVCAVLGHNFPIWLKFKGGKGVATTFGTLIALSWPVGVAACAIWAFSAALFRISSLSALMALTAAPIFASLPQLGNGDISLVLGTSSLALLVWIRHHQNVRRLMKGEEPRIGQK